MASTRILPFAGIVVGALTLTGCIVSPPSAPQPTTPTTSQPTDPTTSPEATAPTESEEPEPTSSAPAASTGSTVTIDGQDVGSWGGLVECSVFGGTALVSSSGDGEAGSLFGTGSDESGSWSASSFLVNDVDASYIQRDETAPATYDGSTFSTEFAATDFSGGTVTIAISVPCS